MNHWIHVVKSALQAGALLIFGVLAVLGLLRVVEGVQATPEPEVCAALLAPAGVIDSRAVARRVLETQR